MMKLIKVKDTSSRWELLSELQPETGCWIVSDVKTKFSVELEILKNHGGLPGFCVMRADEFYKELFFRLDLKWNLTSDDFVQELFLDFCSKQSLSWLKNLKDTNSFFEFFNAFLPVLFHPEGSSLWTRKEQKSVFWRTLFDLSKEFFDFLSSQNTLPSFGLKALLFHHLPELNELSFPKKQLYVDLAFSLDPCEKEIFKEISRRKELFILSPELILPSEWVSPLESDRALNAYRQLEEELGVKNTVSVPVHLPGQKNQSSGKLSSGKFFRVESNTQVEEIRKAVLQVRHWQTAGVPLQDIAIFAPHIEKYWLTLKIYLEKENIPFKKSVVTRVRDFPELQYFCSALRLHLDQFTFEDLEHFSFYREPKREFSQFKADYFHVPYRKLTKKLLFENKSLSPQKKLKGIEFIKWALFFWPKKGDLSLWEKASQVLQKFPMEVSLKASSWLKIFESELFSMEEELKEENPQGISCLSFNAFSSVKSSYMFIMGLNEESLKSSCLAVLNELEKQNLLKDLGFSLPLAHPHEKENSLLWFLQSTQHKEVYLSFSQHDFKGKVQTKSLIYFISESVFRAQKKEIQGELIWDQNRKKQGSVSDILAGSPMEKTSAQAIEKAFQNKKQIIRPQEIKLSPSRLKTYTECPFRYAGKKLFCVEEKVSADLELSPMSKGNLAHKLFEKVLTQYPDLNISKQQIQDLIQGILPNNREIIYEKQWLIISEDLKELLKLFIQKEKDNRQKIGSFKTEVEVKCQTQWNQQKGELDKEGQYEFEGWVDRIDYDKVSDSYVIRDYKASGTELANISKWGETDTEDLQLTFYAQALQKGLIDKFPAGRVSAVFYSVYKDFSIKGFTNKNSSVAEMMTRRSKGLQDQMALDQAIEKSNQWTQSVVQKMKEGKFSPQPKNPKICKKCIYQTWCRWELLDEK